MVIHSDTRDTHAPTHAHHRNHGRCEPHLNCQTCFVGRPQRKASAVSPRGWCSSAEVQIYPPNCILSDVPWYCGIVALWCRGIVPRVPGVYRGVLQLERAIQIEGITIANANSAMITVKAGSLHSSDWHSLVPVTVLMSATDAKTGSNTQVGCLVYHITTICACLVGNPLRADMLTTC